MRDAEPGRRALGVALAALIACGSCGARSELPVPRRPVDPVILDACVKLLSCEQVPDVFFFNGYASISDCVWKNVAAAATWPEGKPAVLTDLLQWTAAACLASAAVCGGVDACLAAGAAIPCPEAEVPSACDGTRAVGCTAGKPVGADCSFGQPGQDPGGVCVETTEGYAWCGVAACAPGSTPPVACDGQTSVACNDGVLQRWLCWPGLACAPGPEGGRCVGSGPPCAADRCDGSDAVRCTEGSEWRTHCPDLIIEGTCALGPQPTAACVPAPGLACDPTAHHDRCEGAILVYCDGEERRTDCASLGFGGCVAAPNGQATCG